METNLRNHSRWLFSNKYSTVPPTRMGNESAIVLILTINWMKMILLLTMKKRVTTTATMSGWQKMNSTFSYDCSILMSRERLKKLVESKLFCTKCSLN
jgi:hypothetical protein